MIAPQIVPRTGVAAAFASTPRKAEPASAFKPSVITAMPRRKRPTPPRMEIIVAKTRPPSGRHFINVPVVRNHRESAGVSGCDISAMLPPNVTDRADAAHLPKGLFTSVAHGQAANQCWTSDYGGDMVLRHRRPGCTCRTASETSKPWEEAVSACTCLPGRPAGSIGTFTLTALGRGEKRQIRRQRQRSASKCRPWIGRRGSLSMITPQHGRWRV